MAPHSAQAAGSLIPETKVAVISGASTLVPLEQPAELARLVLEHWAQAEGRPET